MTFKSYWYWFRSRSAVSGEEGIRKFIAMQYAKVRRMAGIISLVLLMTSDAFLMLPYLEGWGIHPYIGFPMVVLIISVLIWAISHWYYITKDMHRAEQLAEIKLNPYAIYELSPKEQMQLRTQFIPLLVSNARILRNSGDTQGADELNKFVIQLDQWVRSGRIPKDQFPPELDKYIISDKESRL